MRQILAALALFFVLAFWLLVGRGSFGVPHQWYLDPNARLWPAGAFLLPLGVLFIFGGAAALSTFDRFKRAKSAPEKRNSTLTALFCLGLTLFLWPWALLGPGAITQKDPHGGADRLTLEGRFNVIATQWSDVATEYFGVSYQISDARSFGRDYAQKWQKPPSQFQAHVATHPPGATLFFYGLRRVYQGAPPLQNAFESLATTLTRQKLEESRDLANALRLTSSRGIAAPDPPPLPLSAVGNALWSAFVLGFSLVLAIPAVYGLAAGKGGSLSNKRTAKNGGAQNSVVTAPHGSNEPSGDSANTSQIEPPASESDAKNDLTTDAAEKRGLFAVALWVLAPAVNLFAFTLDAPIAVGSLWTLFLVARAIENPDAKRARLAMIGAGILLALTSFLSFGALAVGVIIAATLGVFRREALLRRGAELGLAFLLTWALLALIFAFNPLQVFLQAMQVHRYATLGIRSWGAWMVMNGVMWAPFIGFSMLICALRTPKSRVIGAQIGVATLLVLILLSLSGNVRGEVERLWLFAVAPVAVWAAFAPVSSKTRVILLALQAAQTLLMAATLGPLVRP